MPANYVVIEGGQTIIYSDAHDGQHMPRIIIMGPERVLMYVRTLGTSEGLYIGADGGAVIDVDRRVLRFFGGEDVKWEPYLRPPLLRAVRRRWPGWSVEWAQRGEADVAESAGRDMADALIANDNFAYDCFRSLAKGSGPIISEKEVHVLPDIATARNLPTVRRSAATLLTVLWSDGSVRDYLLVPWLNGSLSLGPHLLDLIEEAESIALPREDDDDLRDLTDGYHAYADVRARVLWLGVPSVVNPLDLSAIGRRWPGWDVRGHSQGLANQVELSGRDPAMVRIPEEIATEGALNELSFGPFSYEHRGEEERRELRELFVSGSDDATS